MKQSALRILIVDDHPLFRDGLRGLLESVPDMAVAGEAGSGEEAIALARRLQPDIILMDLNMRGLDGIEPPARSYSNPLRRTCWW